jgi:hypothetical protein
MCYQMDIGDQLFKELRMADNIQTTNGSDEKNGKVSLEVLAKMTGFPVEVIKDEIFRGEASDQISLESLRTAMLSYIDSTMLINDQK